MPYSLDLVVVVDGWPKVVPVVVLSNHRWWYPYHWGDIFADGGEGAIMLEASPMEWVAPILVRASDPQSVIKDANGKVSYWNDKVSNRHLAQAHC